MAVQVSTWPGLGVGTGSGLIQFSQVFFSSLKGPSMTLLMSDRLKTHTADNSSRSLRKRKSMVNIMTQCDKYWREIGNKSYYRVLNRLHSRNTPALHPCLFLGLPLGSEQSIEVCGAGVAWHVLCGENISQDVIALTTGFVLTHQLGLEKGGPTALQSLHPSHIRLNRQGEKDKPD